MSSINPTILLPGALELRCEQLVSGFIASMILGAGQFCTNPGIVLLLDGDEADRFVEAAATALGSAPAQVMLTPGIHQNYERGVARLGKQPQVRACARGAEPTGSHAGRAALFSSSAEALLANPTLAEEIFGAASLIVRCRDQDELRAVLESLEGQLTLSLHMEGGDSAIAGQLIPVMERKAGRLIINGWPTGVEVSHAMVHGGPYPATSDGSSTSVGTLAIDRFLRPVCYQDFPDSLLPAELRREQPRPFLHRLDGRYQAEAKSDKPL
jgi:2,5-dioxopentanoate dehydrogenase